MKKTILSTVLAALLLALSACASAPVTAPTTSATANPTTNPTTSPTAEPTKAAAQVDVQVVAKKNADSIEMKIIITNNTASAVKIEFTSGQQFDFDLLDASKTSLYRWSADKSFMQQLSTTTIEAGKTLELGDTLSGDVYAGIKDKIAYMKAFITGKADFINVDGYEVAVK